MGACASSAGPPTAYLNPKPRPPLEKVERRPIAGAMLPPGLDRHGHHFLDDLAAHAVEEDGGAEEAAGEAGDEGGGVHMVKLAALARGDRPYMFTVTVYPPGENYILSRFPPTQIGHQGLQSFPCANPSETILSNFLRLPEHERGFSVRLCNQNRQNSRRCRPQSP